MQITRGKIKSAQKVVIYGPEGIGKSTFASQFPNPVFIDTEGSTKHMDVARLPKPSSWTMLVKEVKYIKQNPHICDTLIIDTTDWAEQLCMNELCAKAQKKGIEDFGYGKGYVYLAEEFGRFLNLLEELIELGINVVLVAHAQMRKFEQPDEMGAYDRWELKLQKKTFPLIKEWADMILFANYKTYVINVDGQGAEKGKNKAQGGKRIMYTTHHPCWDAKNRHDLPPELLLDYKTISHCIIPRDELKINTMFKSKEPKPEPELESHLNSEPEYIPEQDPEPEFTDADVPFQDEDKAEPESNIPKALLDLMQQNDVTYAEIQDVVAKRGYYPANTPIENYDPDFINGVLVGAWKQVYEMILKNRDKVPF